MHNRYNISAIIEQQSVDSRHISIKYPTIDRYKSDVEERLMMGEVPPAD